MPPRGSPRLWPQGALHLHLLCTHSAPALWQHVGLHLPAATRLAAQARLSRLLSDEAAVARLAALMVELGVRVVRLSRRNVVKQALAQYRRLHHVMHHVIHYVMHRVMQAGPRRVP